MNNFSYSSKTTSLGNAPKQGAFAIVVAISFFVHLAILLQNALSYQAIARSTQADVILAQLVQSSQLYFNPKDTVSMALLVNQYAQQTAIANIQIIAADKTLLASNGGIVSPFSQRFTTDVKQNTQVIGHIIVHMAPVNPGEVIQHQWGYFLFSLIIHLSTWLCYRALARPSYRFDTQVLGKPLSNKTQNSTRHQHPENTSQSPAIAPVSATMPTASASSQQSTTTSAAPVQNNNVQRTTSEVAPTPQPNNNDQTIVNITFTDPSDLLDTLSPKTLDSYFQLLQTLLEHSITNMNGLIPQGLTQIHIVQSFIKTHRFKGAQVAFKGSSAEILAFAAQLAILFNMLSEAVYKHHKQNHRFALYTQCVISEASPTGESAQQIAQNLLSDAPKNGVLVHVLQQHSKSLLRDYEFYSTKHLALNSSFYAANILEVIDEGLQHSLQEAAAQILER